ncbi:hypothetical protein QR685DRAFT_437666 [Neurospora intermedia]|uniref:Uncharacterized protein n=1 Tax=Neurospora intermedia TaxID=5142 RepID=A0ABR3DFY7_NEUIN
MISNRLIIPNLDGLGIEPRTFRIQVNGKPDDEKKRTYLKDQGIPLKQLGQVNFSRYGDADTAGTVDLTTVLETPSFSRRCGSNEIKCFNENQAATSPCKTLVSVSLATRNSFPNSPRCVRQGGNEPQEMPRKC